MMLKTPKITQIAANAPGVYAFRIEGGVSSDEMDAMARVVEQAFDRHDKIRMLILLHDFHASDALSGLTLQGVSTQTRSIAHVERYAVVGAPSIAAMMVETFEKILPVEARAFDIGEEEAAWAFVGARLAAPAASEYPPEAADMTAHRSA